MWILSLRAQFWTLVSTRILMRTPTGAAIGHSCNPGSVGGSSGNPRSTGLAALNCDQPLQSKSHDGPQSDRALPPVRHGVRTRLCCHCQINPAFGVRDSTIGVLRLEGQVPWGRLGPKTAIRYLQEERAETKKGSP